jgi:hypothetical protein
MPKALMKFLRTNITAAKFPALDFHSDGNPGRGIEEFWAPHWRFLETYDEHFDHPAQLRSATSAPLHGRWRIYGVGLPDNVLRKVYYANALRYLPTARASIQKQSSARR